MDISSRIMNRLVQILTEECQTKVPANDRSRVKRVQKGMFQDDPSEWSPVVAVHRNYHDAQLVRGGWFDERIRREIGVALGAPAIEQWYRRFTVEVIVWPEGLNQDEAEELNSQVVGRVRKALTRADMGDLEDDFGERVIVGINPVVMMGSRESGGPDDEYAWRTILFLEYVTEHVPD